MTSWKSLSTRYKRYNRKWKPEDILKPSEIKATIADMNEGTKENRVSSYHKLKTTFQRFVNQVKQHSENIKLHSTKAKKTALKAYQESYSFKA